jgi:hypothetical protein
MQYSTAYELQGRVIIATLFVSIPSQINHQYITNDPPHTHSFTPMQLKINGVTRVKVDGMVHRLNPDLMIDGFLLHTTYKDNVGEWVWRSRQGIPQSSCCTHC